MESPQFFLHIKSKFMSAVFPWDWDTFLEHDWASFGHDWVSFESQLGWFSYAGAEIMIKKKKKKSISFVIVFVLVLDLNFACNGGSATSLLLSF